ncbi:hypothetical protein F9K94_21770 [Brucella tritici]|uniref:Uncharacterized protein n=1 Tax=Brucella tritici TaxID=94626 RepID=A0A7V7VR76_9HYPH|nr:hypothetical protein [Brucella tritici]KAB2655183.1 hypothetical protein F9K94_21770 [Brucella tritici]
MIKNEYDMRGRVIITEVKSETEATPLQLPELNTATNSHVSKVSRLGNDIFLKLTQPGQLATGVVANGEVGIYMFDDAMDASIIWHDSSGEQRIDLTHDDVKRHFGSYAGILENPLLALKVIKPEIEL